jgi:dipeptidase E
MRYLLTSSDISNTSICHALVDLLGKVIAESSALVIPNCAVRLFRGLTRVYQLIRGVARSPLCALAWKSLAILELIALLSINKETWVSLVQEVKPCW